MKNTFYILLTILCFYSCTEDDQPLGLTSTVNLKFHAVFDGQPFAINQPYDYPGGSKVMFSQFNLFISNVALLEEGTGDEVDLLEIKLADFKENTSPATAQPVVYNVKNVPAVKYRGIRIGIGVPSGLNRSSASNFGAGHVLRKNYDSHFWKDAGSFYFMKINGIYDLNNDGIFGAIPDDHPFSHYPAKNSVYRTITLLKPIDLQPGQSFDFNILLDLLKLYTKDGTPLDLSKRENLTTDNPNDLSVAKYLMDNLPQAMTLQ